MNQAAITSPGSAVAPSVDVESRQFMNMLKCTSSPDPKQSIRRSILANTGFIQDERIIKMSANLRQRLHAQLEE